MTDASTGEAAALVELYDATDGANWKSARNWLTGAPVGEWQGVSTDDVGKIIRVELYDNGLNGRIPSELGDLQYLEWLSLEVNELSGQIPPQLGNLTSLERLDSKAMS